jgi:titin
VTTLHCHLLYKNPRQSLPQLREGALLHVDAQLEPVADPTLRVEWFHNGEPVRNTNRMKAIHDFGCVALELCPVEPQDNGTWLCRATNAQGQAETQCEIEASQMAHYVDFMQFFPLKQVAGESGVSYEWVSPGERKERIEELEDWINRPKAELQEPAKDFEAPQFKEQLQEAGTKDETQAHAFSCVLEPVGDPSMRVEWQHDGHPVPYSNRIQMSNDFGVITLLIKHLIAQDTGEYRLVNLVM